MSGHSGPVSPSDAMELVNSANASSYSLMAIVALLAYDQVICLDKEIEHIWRKPKAVITWLYIMTRLLSLVASVSNLAFKFYRTDVSTCLDLRITYNVFYIVSLLLIQYITLLRVEALYYANTTLKKSLLVFFIIMNIANAILGLHSIELFDTGIIFLGNGLGLCTASDVIFAEYCVSWTCILVSEFVFMLLAIRRAAIIWRETCKINGLNLAKVLIRDQACYFLAVLFIGIMEPVSYDTNSPIISVFPYPGIVVPLGCRLLINMREAGDNGLRAGMTCGSEGGSGIKFAEHSGLPRRDDNVYEMA